MPANSGLLNFWRQLDIFDPRKHNGLKVYIVGAGAIGSMTGLVLSKMGFSDITVWDDDKIESHNLPNQMYPLDAIGKHKVDALSDVVKGFAGCTVNALKEKWNNHPFDGDAIVIVCTDNMTSRKAVWKKVKLKGNVRLFIDARMGGETMRIYSIDPMSIKQGRGYENTLYTDEESVELPCTAQSIIYNLAGISGIVANQIKKRLTGDDTKPLEYFHEIVFDYKCMALERERFE